MAVEVCHDAWRQVATMYCNTSDTAFGPIFTGPNAGTEIEDFLNWIRDGDAIGHAARLVGDGTDARDYGPDVLERLVGVWRDQYVPVVPEPQSLRVREPDGYRLDGGRMIPTDR